MRLVILVTKRLNLLPYELDDIYVVNEATFLKNVSMGKEFCIGYNFMLRRVQRKSGKMRTELYSPPAHRVETIQKQNDSQNIFGCM
jgi:hypothetical protein